MEALKTDDPLHPIVQEVARLMKGYSQNFSAHVTRLGHIPKDILHPRPSTPIEGVAMRLVTQAIQGALKQ